MGDLDDPEPLCRLLAQVRPAVVFHLAGTISTSRWDQSLHHTRGASIEES